MRASRSKLCLTHTCTPQLGLATDAHTGHTTPQLQTDLPMQPYVQLSTYGHTRSLLQMPLFSASVTFFFPSKDMRHCSGRKEPERCSVREDAVPCLALGRERAVQRSLPGAGEQAKNREALARSQRGADLESGHTGR